MKKRKRNKSSVKELMWSKGDEDEEDEFIILQFQINL